MQGMREAVDRVIEAQRQDRKARRYTKLLQAQHNRRLTQEQVKRVCLAIGDWYRSKGAYRTDRVVLPDPSPISRKVSAEERKEYETAIKSRRRAQERNRLDQAWLEKLDREIGDAFELDESEQRWFVYVTKGGEMPVVG